MCLLLILFTLKCVTTYPHGDYVLAYIPIDEFSSLQSAGIEAIPLPFYGNILMNADPRAIEAMLLQQFWSSYLPNKGPLSFGGPVRGKGSVNIVGGFGSRGYGSFTSYSAPPTPVYVTSQLILPTVTSLPTVSTLPTVTSLPVVTVPSSENVVAVPAKPMSATMPMKLLPNAIETGNIGMIDDIDIRSNFREASAPVAKPVKFSGMVPASGSVKICATFC